MAGWWLELGGKLGEVGWRDEMICIWVAGWCGSSGLDVLGRLARGWENRALTSGLRYRDSFFFRIFTANQLRVDRKYSPNQRLMRR